MDLLLTDMVMPGMIAIELSGRLRETYPELKVLFMSGHADDILNRHRAVPDPQLMVHKPFSLASLADRIREVLDH